MTRARGVAVGLVALMAFVGCTDDEDAVASHPRPDPAPPQSSLDEVGTCRGSISQQEEAGLAVIEWIQLRTALPVQPVVVFTTRSLEDLGERDIYGGEDITDMDLPHLVGFGDPTVLAGDLEEPVEALIGRFVFSDSRAELAAKAELLVWVSPQPESPAWATIAALTEEGDVAFLGDCHPGWDLAFNDYAEKAGGDLHPAELLTRIVAQPAGPEAQAFRESREADTLAGPVRG